MKYFLTVKRGPIISHDYQIFSIRKPRGHYVDFRCPPRRMIKLRQAIVRNLFGVKRLMNSRKAAGFEKILGSDFQGLLFKDLNFFSACPFSRINWKKNSFALICTDGNLERAILMKCRMCTLWKKSVSNRLKNKSSVVFK